jgi:hypothetical protein
LASVEGLSLRYRKAIRVSTVIASVECLEEVSREAWHCKKVWGRKGKEIIKKREDSFGGMNIVIVNDGEDFMGVCVCV